MARDLRNPDIEIKLTKSKENKGEEQGLECLQLRKNCFGKGLRDLYE